MHEIETHKYADAAATLKTLAHNETNKVANKKTLLSISKLAMLASGNNSQKKLVKSNTKSISRIFFCNIFHKN